MMMMKTTGLLAFFGFACAHGQRPVLEILQACSSEIDFSCVLDTSAVDLVDTLRAHKEATEAWKSNDKEGDKPARPSDEVKASLAEVRQCLTTIKPELADDSDCAAALSPTRQPVFAQPVSVCVDDDNKLQQILEAKGHTGTVTGGCSNAFIQPYCRFNAISNACCLSCPGLWTEMFIPYAPGADDTSMPAEYTGPYLANDLRRQHLHIRQAEGPGPHPVYFMAHGNGGEASNIGSIPAATITDEGYTLISWESVTTIETGGDGGDSETCMSDASLVVQWAKDNHEQYNLDVNRFIIGGRSRGSICSWKVAHSNDAAIIGIYMYGALPDGVWDAPEVWTPVDEVTADSPPAWLGYSADCGPGPITHDCTMDDIHNPRHGLTIADAYAELGIAEKIEVIDGLQVGDQRVNIFAHFADFVAGL